MSQGDETANRPLLSVVVPVFNEVRTIGRILDAVRAVEIDKEIIVVDDCSTDGTREKLGALGARDRRLRVLLHERNQGKGAALRTGIAAAQGRFVVVQDADLEYDPRDFERLITPLVRDEADVVYGSRFVSENSHPHPLTLHRFGNQVLTWMSNACTNMSLTDMETCYKMFRRELIQSIPVEENRFGFEPEITAKLSRYREGKRSLRILEVPISYRGRSNVEGKKIGWRDGFRAIWCIVKYNLF
ncbi:MAG: glycosyltransferase family 2 protein [Pirellulales bacterium]